MKEWLTLSDTTRGPRALCLRCEDLTKKQLHTTIPGAHGSIIATIWQTVTSEAGQWARLTGEESRWVRRTETVPSLAQLEGYIDDIAAW